MNKLTAFKVLANIVVGVGTTGVTNSIIRNNVNPANAFEQVCTGVASLVIGSMATEATRAHTNAKIDETVALWNSKSDPKNTTTA